MKNFLPLTLCLFSLFFFTSCGGSDSNDSSNTPPGVQLPQDEEEEEIVGNFSTRLESNLLVAGTRCQGGETTTNNEGDITYTCERDNWLVTVDNINSCTPDGTCTEAAVLPFVSELDRSDRVSRPEIRLYSIDPLQPVSPGQQAIINNVLVRFNLNTDTAKVIRR